MATLPQTPLQHRKEITMEYSEHIAIRDFVLDYLIEDGGVIEAEADRVPRGA